MLEGERFVVQFYFHEISPIFHFLNQCSLSVYLRSLDYHEHLTICN